MGFRAGLQSFTAAVLGGIGNITGAMLGGFLIGLLASFSDGYLERPLDKCIGFRNTRSNPALPSHRLAR